MTSTEYQQLVEYLGRQFTAVDERFVAIDGRFAGLERRMDSLEERVSAGFRDVLGHFDEIYRRLERLEQEYYAVTQALRRIEALLGDEGGRREMLERSLETLKRDVANLQARIEGIEERLRR